MEIFCRRCMVPDYIEDKEAFIEKYVDIIKPEERTDDAVYESRLRKCEKCEHHQNGICRLCGCFVVIRAVARRQSCPASPGRWGKA